ncbi:MAG: type II toxin-antitoxin system RelE/ParE family toxin [Pseudomonadota bacterium]
MTVVRFLPDAETELLHEVAYYSAAGAGVGIRFQVMVEAATQLAVQHPLGGSPYPHGTRAALVKGFPFSVIYRASETELLIVAIAPHRRRPNYWKSRV